MWRGCAAAKHLFPTGGGVTLWRGEVPMFWWFTGFVLFGYLTGMAGVSSDVPISVEIRVAGVAG